MRCVVGAGVDDLAERGALVRAGTSVAGAAPERLELLKIDGEVTSNSPREIKSALTIGGVKTQDGGGPCLER